MGPGHAQAAQPAAASGQNITRPMPPRGNVPHRQAGVADDVHRRTEKDGRPARTPENRVRGPRVHERADDLHRVRRRGVHVDLRDGVLGALRVLEVLRERGLGDSCARVVEQHVQGHQKVNVPGGEDLLELGLGVRGAVGTAFELHAFLGELALVRLEVPCLCDLRHIREQEVAGQCDRQGNHTVDDEKPLPSIVSQSQPSASLELPAASVEENGNGTTYPLRPPFPPRWCTAAIK